jgi:hypothetical protein
MRPLLKNPLLRRYWFPITNCFTLSGFGVTAYSRADAEEILRISHFLPWQNWVVQEVVEDIDVSQLVDNVRKNMGPPNLRGVWYPCLNLLPGWLIEGQEDTEPRVRELERSTSPSYQTSQILTRRMYDKFGAHPLSVKWCPYASKKL